MWSKCPSNMENPRRKRLAHINLIPEDSNMFEALNKFMHLDKNIWQKDAAVLSSLWACYYCCSLMAGDLK